MDRVARGARNLLVNCAGAQAGQRLLIATEPEALGYYEAGLATQVAAVARALGLEVTVQDVGFDPDAPHLSPTLIAQIDAADIVLFLARLGDQLRFSEMPPGKTVVVSFALDTALLGSGFGTAHYDAFLALKAEVNTMLAEARRVRITCPAGTDVVGQPDMDLSPAGDTTVRRFPMSIFTPVPARGFSGRVALPGFLTGTGSRYYADYTLPFDGPLWAHIDGGRLLGFEGAAPDVAAAEAQYTRVATEFGIARDVVHSWHAGIHPGCGYPWDIHDNYERWGGAAFGNPRILHFHTCGAYAPGEISWNVIDPTIEIDGVAYWQGGTFHAERLPRGRDILRAYPCAAAVFAAPDRRIGLVAPRPMAAARPALETAGETDAVTPSLRVLH